MADTKISALPASTTPLAGTEVLPIVQGGATRQISVANLTAGRSVSAAELTLSTGNLVIGTAGKGIDFSTTGQAGGMTSELLSDYEEGTWTPTLDVESGSTGTWDSTLTGRYTKIGNQVTCFLKINGTSMGLTTSTSFRQYTGLPFTPTLEGTGVFTGSTLAVSGRATAFTNAKFLITSIYSTSATSSIIYLTITYQTS